MLPWPMRIQAWLQLAEQLLKLGDAAAALETLPTEAESPLAAAVRAEATWAVDGSEAALALATAAAAKHRDSARLAGLVGRLHVDRGEWQQATEALDAALKIKPSDLESLQALASAYERMGRKDDADATRQRRDIAQKGLEKLPSMPPVAPPAARCGPCRPVDRGAPASSRRRPASPAVPP
jgi:uncharacterized protein HemY